MDELLDRYGLKGDDVERQITEVDIDKISHCYCKEWKRLPAYLQMGSIAENDVSHSAGTEEDKRRDFFARWKSKEGSGATYKVLIKVLLEIECRSDAEGVCEVLKKSKQAALSLDTSSTAATKPIGIGYTYLNLCRV